MTTRPNVLTGTELQAAFELLPSWSLGTEKKTLNRTFKFAAFSDAWAFMTRVALLAEKLDHHPDWSNSYNRVVVSLCTHDKGGVTSLDVKMAETMDHYYSER